MHDPQVLAFNIKIPFTNIRLIDIWHVDNCKDGTDNNCGWHMRARHGDKKVLKEIISAFKFEWSSGVPFGWFDKETGRKPNYSSQAITLGMFRIAANEVFGHWSKKADRFLRYNIFHILHFAENSCDSLYTSITNHYYFKLSEKDKRSDDRCQNLDDRIEEMARCIYAWILNQNRPWWKHPRWHFWHWKLQIHSLQAIRRKWISRCHICGKRFSNHNEPVIGRHWDNPPKRWFEFFRSEQDISHMSCEKVYLGTTIHQGDKK